MRATQARSSSSERALASETSAAGGVTFSSRETGSAPTRWVGESGVTSSGCSRLDRAQLVEQRVVDVVADLGVVEDVVAVVVVRELLAQLGGPLRASARAAHSTSRAAGASRRARS